MPDQLIKEVKSSEQYRRKLGVTTIVPMLRLEGHILEKYGFHTGATIVVKYSKDRLVLKPKLSRSAYRKALKAAEEFDPNPRKTRGLEFLNDIERYIRSNVPLPRQKKE